MVRATLRMRSALDGRHLGVGIEERYGSSGKATVTSSAAGGTGAVATLPPGQRTMTDWGGSGMPNTATALSCDQ